MPSIASVSRFELQTRAAGADAGTEIVMNGGKFVHVRDCGRPPGTRVIVSQLFNSVPARRKFLKSEATESAHIIHCVRLYALACPRAAFTLIENGRVIFRSPVCATTGERVAEIFGRLLAEALLPVEAEEAGLRLQGLVGRPGIGRATRHEMITFVNQRPVDSRTLNYALIESYHESIPKGRYPFAFLFLELDPAAVDVNVHPAKREVRFRHEAQVRAFVIRAVLARLGSIAGGGVRSKEWPTPGSTVPAAVRPPAVSAGGSPTPGLVSPSAPESRIAAPFPAWRPAVAPSPPAAAAAAPTTPFAGRAAPVEWRYLGLAHGVYALFETGAGLVLLDRRAAHERIWYERLREQFAAGRTATQRLLLPVPIELDAIATALLLDRLDFINRHGFEVAEFGRNFFRVEGAPDWMDPADAEPFLRDLLGEWREGRLPAGNPDLARDELARLAAVRAVRLPAGTSELEMQSLLVHLLACHQPLTSPAGRPTYVELSHGELARRFQK